MSRPAFKLNPALQSLGISATLRIQQTSSDLIRQGHTITKFGLGQSPFPVPDHVVRSLQVHASEKSYMPVAGLQELREEIAAHLLRTRGLSYSPNNIVIGPGSKELLFILQLACEAELLLPAPSWVSYAPQAIINRRRLTWLPAVPENNWKPTAEILDAVCRKYPGPTRLLLLNYPNNPVGYSFNEKELRELAKVAAQHRILILSDEIYSGVNHYGNHQSIANFYPEGTIISDGLSKWAGAGGWRLGFIALPESLAELRDSALKVASETFTSVSAPIQFAAIQAFSGGAAFGDYLDRSRAILRALARALAARLRTAGASVPEPDGGFYLFPDFGAFHEGLKQRGLSTSLAMCEAILRETGVAVLPGSAFGRPDDEFTLRLSYVDFDGAKALAALPPSHDIDDQFLRAYCGACLTGIDKICRWLEDVQ